MIPALLLTLTALAQDKGAARRATSPPEGRRYAIVIGVEDYEDVDIRDLSYTDEDARAVARYFREVAGFDQVVELSTAPGRERPTRAEIVETIENFTSPDGPDTDTLVVYFSGHGVAGPEEDFGGLKRRANYLLPADARYGQTLSVETAVRLEWVVSRVAASKARQRLVIADACRNDPFKTMGGPEPMVVEPLARSVQVLMASRFGEVAYEDGEARLSAFTAAWLDALSGEADQDGDMEIAAFSEAFPYVKRRLAERIERGGHVQVPRVNAEEWDGEDLRLPAGGAGARREGPIYAPKAPEGMALDAKVAARLARRWGRWESRAYIGQDLIFAPASRRACLAEASAELDELVNRIDDGVSARQAELLERRARAAVERAYDCGGVDGAAPPRVGESLALGQGDPRETALGFLGRRVLPPRVMGSSTPGGWHGADVWEGRYEQEEGPTPMVDLEAGLLGDGQRLARGELHFGTATHSDATGGFDMFGEIVVPSDAWPVEVTILGGTALDSRGETWGGGLVWEGPARWAPAPVQLDASETTMGFGGLALPHLGHKIGPKGLWLDLGAGVFASSTESNGELAPLARAQFDLNQQYMLTAQSAWLLDRGLTSGLHWSLSGSAQTLPDRPLLLYLRVGYGQLDGETWRTDIEEDVAVKISGLDGLLLEADLGLRAANAELAAEIYAGFGPSYYGAWSVQRSADLRGAIHTRGWGLSASGGLFYEEPQGPLTDPEYSGDPLPSSWWSGRVETQLHRDLSPALGLYLQGRLLVFPEPVGWSWVIPGTSLYPYTGLGLSWTP